MQASLIPEDAEEATLYGLTTDDLPLLLLCRPALKRLNIVLLNQVLTRTLLEHGILSGLWLADQRVSLSLGRR